MNKIDIATRWEMVRLSNEGFSHRQIAAKFGVSRGTASSIIWRIRNPEAAHKDSQKPGEPKVGDSAKRQYRGVEAARHPYAPDSSEPEFAHDDLHLKLIARANNGLGFLGFPVVTGPVLKTINARESGDLRPREFWRAA